MALRSHVDPVLYTRFILLDEDDIGAEYVSACRAVNDPAELRILFDDICKRHPRLMFHEAYHCFQGLWTPFLNRYALLAWYGGIRAFELLSQESGDHRNWSIEVPAFRLLSRRARLCRTKSNGSRIHIGQSLSVLDIVEGITSLIEWQLYARDERISSSDLRLFARWRKRNPAYLKLYEAIAEVIGPARALSSSVALGTATLYTSSPIRALGRLTSRIESYLNERNSANKYDQLNPLERSSFILEQLNQLEYEAGVNATSDLLDQRLFRLKFPWGPDYPTAHPLLAHLEPGAFGSSTTNEGIQFLTLVHPESFSDVRAFFENNCLAPKTTIKVRFNDGLVRTFGTIHPNYGSSFGMEKSTDDAKDAVRFHTTIWSVVRRASGGFYDPEQRTCELQSCPEWRFNFCNAYSPTPLDYTKCKFLPDLAALRKGYRR